MYVKCHVLFPGDPTVFGNLPLPVTCEEAVQESITKRSYNGYCPSVGQFILIITPLLDKDSTTITKRSYNGYCPSVGQFILITTPLLDKDSTTIPKRSYTVRPSVSLS